MTSTFNCPKCGAPMDYSGRGESIRCPYCHNAVIVPPELRVSQQADTSQTPAYGAADAGLPPGFMQASGSRVLTTQQLADVKRLLREGKKIEAIKIYRQATMLGLKEAKDAVEAMQAADPELQKMAPPANAKKSKLAAFMVALFFFGIASIFPLVFIPMGMDAWQMGEYGGAIGAYFGAAIWAIVWGGIGALILFS